LPPALIAMLGLRWQTMGRGVLADGSKCLINEYECNIIWDRRTISIVVDECDSMPLVGMALLTGYELKMQVRERGKVTIKRLR
jgi:hypothetical protein